jgi:hypothetical protein
LDFTVVYETPAPEGSGEMTPPKVTELRLRCASREERESWYECLESSRLVQAAAKRVGPPSGRVRKITERSLTLEAGAKSETRGRKGGGGSKPSRGSRARDPEDRVRESDAAIVAAGGMDELQAELEWMRQSQIHARGGSVASDAGGPGASPESVRSTSSPEKHLSAQAMLRQSPEPREPEPEPEVDAWGRPILHKTAADEYRPPHMLNPEKGEMLWLKPSTVAFDLGQPYGTDYRLHDKTVHECGSTVTGRVFDAGRPFQRSSVYVGQKQRVEKENSGRRRRPKGGAGALGGMMGGSSDEEEMSPEEVVQKLMSDPMQVEQMRVFATAHLEKAISTAVIDEIRELTENGKVE